MMRAAAVTEKVSLSRPVRVSKGIGILGLEAEVLLMMS